MFSIFLGTARVGHALKGAGYQVYSNDLNAYAATLARCYVEADQEIYQQAASERIAELNKLPGLSGWFTETYCVESRFFKPSQKRGKDWKRFGIRFGHGPLSRCWNRFF